MIKIIQQWLVDHMGWDGIAHCSISAYFTLLAILITHNLLISIAIVLTIGIIKEFVDLASKGEFSIHDLIADASGIGISVLVSLFI